MPTPATIWSQETYLMWYNTTTSAYELLVPIKDYPDLGGAPDTIEDTDLSQTRTRTYIRGLQDSDNLEFTVNYNGMGEGTNWQAAKVAAEAGEQNYALWFGSNGAIDDSKGAFYFPGELDAWLLGKGVNEAKEFVISITPTDGITDEDPLVNP